MALSPVFAQTNTARDTGGLKGTVKSVRIEQAHFEEEISGEVVESPRTISQSISYNHRGNYEEIAHYDNMGVLVWNWAVKYDLAGTRQEEFSYEANGTSRSVYKYSSNGRKCRVTEYNPDGSLSSWHVSVYDSNGNETSRKHYDVDGRLIGNYVYKYDQKGRKVEEIVYGRNATPAHTARKRTYTYDSKGNLSEMWAYERPRGGFLGKRIYKYDDDGNLVEEYYVGGDGKTRDRSTYSYEFDSQGNWIKRITHKESLFYGKSVLQPKVATYRTITYF
jgi:hypothetical protein